LPTWALDGGFWPILRESMITSDIGVTDWGKPFLSASAGAAEIYALDGGSWTTLRTSIILSYIGVPLWGWAFLSANNIFPVALSPSMTASDIGLPLYGNFYSSWALEGGFWPIFRESMMTSDIGVTD
jgi:hypothetical protein